MTVIILQKIKKTYRLLKFAVFHPGEIAFSRSTQSKIRTDFTAKDWKEHHFGLSDETWKSLHGGSYWITGAGTGYGRSISCALAAAGGTVILSGRRIVMLQKSLDEMKALGINTKKCHLIPLDITKWEDIQLACENVAKICTSLDGLVNNAAIPSRPGSQYPLQCDPVDYWDTMMATNVKGPWLLTRTIFPHMRKKNSVRILFMSSEAGWASTPGVGMYNLSKAAVNSLGHSLAMEYAKRYPDDDIQINIVQPGEAKTEMNQGSSESPFSVVGIILTLLSQKQGSANGKFFDRNGRHLQFGYTWPYEHPLK